MSRFLKHALRSVVFLTVLALLLTGVSQLLRPKNNSRDGGIHDPAANGILGEPEHTIDLLILGDSESYSAFIPTQLWQQRGYTAYCCGTSGQTLYYSEEFLHKAFQTQSPKVVILETNAIFRGFSYGGALLSEAGKFFPVFTYHNRWKTLKTSDLTLTVDYNHIDSAKGYQFTDGVAPAGIGSARTDPPAQPRLCRAHQGLLRRKRRAAPARQHAQHRQLEHGAPQQHAGARRPAGHSLP